MNWESQKTLEKIFNIGDVEFKTFKSLPESSRLDYIKRFKKSISVDDFDEFCSSNKISNELKLEVLKIWDIDKCPIVFYINKSRFTEEREKSIQFNRDLKIKLLCQ